MLDSLGKNFNHRFLCQKGFANWMVCLQDLSHSLDEYNSIITSRNHGPNYDHKIQVVTIGHFVIRICVPIQSRIQPTVPSPPQASTRKSGTSWKKLSLKDNRRFSRFNQHMQYECIVWSFSTQDSSISMPACITGDNP